MAIDLAKNPRIAASVYRQDAETLQRERDRMRSALCELVMWVRGGGKAEASAAWYPGGVFPKDHACAECVPGGDIVIEGFRCSWHAAVALARPPDDSKPPPEGP